MLISRSSTAGLLQLNDICYDYSTSITTVKRQTSDQVTPEQAFLGMGMELSEISTDII